MAKFCIVLDKHYLLVYEHDSKPGWETGELCYGCRFCESWGDQIA